MAMWQFVIYELRKTVNQFHAGVWGNVMGSLYINPESVKAVLVESNYTTSGYS